MSGFIERTERMVQQAGPPVGPMVVFDTGGVVVRSAGDGNEWEPIVEAMMLPAFMQVPFLVIVTAFASKRSDIMPVDDPEASRMLLWIVYEEAVMTRYGTQQLAVCDHGHLTAVEDVRWLDVSKLQRGEHLEAIQYKVAAGWLIAPATDPLLYAAGLVRQGHDIAFLVEEREKEE